MDSFDELHQQIASSTTHFHRLTTTTVNLFIGSIFDFYETVESIDKLLFRSQNYCKFIYR